ncbi:MAG: DUF2769 domain-containing protein [Candidatus Bathyarchaeota archaeon]
MVPDTEENMNMCRCLGCPTFKGSPLSGGFFCAKGKAKEKVKKANCLCPSCSIFKKYGLKTGYFCINGKSADM